MLILVILQSVLDFDRVIADISGLRLWGYKFKLSWACIECGQVRIAGCAQVIVAWGCCWSLRASVVSKLAAGIGSLKGRLNLYSACRIEAIIVEVFALDYLLWANVKIIRQNIVVAEPSFDTWVVLERYFVDKLVLASIVESMGIYGQLFLVCIASKDRSVQGFIRAVILFALLPFDFIVSTRGAARHISERDKVRPIGPL